MTDETRVCPHCGEPPGAGVFCDGCGRNLSGVEQLPTRAEWHAGPTGPQSLADRCAAATQAFLAAMHAAGDPGAEKTSFRGGSGLRRRPRAWVVREVSRTNEDPLHYEYEPGLILTTDGRFHRLESEVRGWGQARFPLYVDTATSDPIEAPVDDRLIDELAALLRAHDVAAE
jgi:hypothetical protein